jgi:hypothetical protein
MPSGFSHLSDSAPKRKGKKKKKKNKYIKSGVFIRVKITTQDRYSLPKAKKQKMGHVLSNN